MLRANSEGHTCWDKGLRLGANPAIVGHDELMTCQLLSAHSWWPGDFPNEIFQHVDTAGLPEFFAADRSDRSSSTGMMFPCWKVPNTQPDSLVGGNWLPFYAMTLAFSRNIGFRSSSRHWRTPSFFRGVFPQAPTGLPPSRPSHKKHLQIEMPKPSPGKILDLADSAIVFLACWCHELLCFFCYYRGYYYPGRNMFLILNWKDICKKLSFMISKLIKLFFKD